MEVHAHTHTPRKKWTHYFWEFFMLFLAVTLGFIVENKREHYIENQRSLEYVRGLLYDLSRDTSRLTDDIEYYTWRENAVDSLIRLLSTDERNHDATRVYPLLRSMDTWRIPVGFSNTYDDLKTSGLLRYFTASGLAGKLKSYYQAYINFFYYEEELAQYVKDFCEPFLDRYFEGKFYITRDSMPHQSMAFFQVPTDKKLVIPDPVKQTLLNMAIRMRYKKIGFNKISSICETQRRTAIDLINILTKKYKIK